MVGVGGDVGVGVGVGGRVGVGGGTVEVAEGVGRTVGVGVEGWVVCSMAGGAGSGYGRGRWPRDASVGDAAGVVVGAGVGRAVGCRAGAGLAVGAGSGPGACQTQRQQQPNECVEGQGPCLRRWSLSVFAYPGVRGSTPTLCFGGRRRPPTTVHWLKLPSSEGIATVQPAAASR